MFKKMLTVVAAVSLAFTGLVGAPSVSAAPTLERVRVMKSCTAEDSSTSYPCLWDATKRGNKKGKSFVRYNEEHNEWVTDIMRWPHLYAETCERAGKHYRCYVTR